MSVQNRLYLFVRLISTFSFVFGIITCRICNYFHINQVYDCQVHRIGMPTVKYSLSDLLLWCVSVWSGAQLEAETYLHVNDVIIKEKISDSYHCTTTLTLNILLLCFRANTYNLLYLPTAQFQPQQQIIWVCNKFRKCNLNILSPIYSLRFWKSLQFLSNIQNVEFVLCLPYKYVL